MELPELKVATVEIFAARVCAICDMPCVHEVPEKMLPSPGAYVASTVDDQYGLALPVCDPCVERHYPEFVAEIEAARLHYWTH